MDAFDGVLLILNDDINGILLSSLNDDNSIQLIGLTYDHNNEDTFTEHVDEQKLKR